MGLSWSKFSGRTRAAIIVVVIAITCGIFGEVFLSEEIKQSPALKVANLAFVILTVCVAIFGWYSDRKWRRESREYRAMLDRIHNEIENNPHRLEDR